MNKLYYVLLSIVLLSLSACRSVKEFDFPDSGVRISKVESAFYVDYSIVEKNDKLYMAYYDDKHDMTLAVFDPETGACDYEVLPSKIGWDSHNYMTLAFDKDGFIHLSGNMHAVPLVYFRSDRPYDIHSMKEIDYMTGADEQKVTYPTFMTLQNGDLVFHYRIGGSGNGSEIYNIYDCDNKEWKRLLDRPLIDGKGKMNAYMQGPMLGNDGYYHMIWVWRDSPDCSTNHTLSYAKSKDLIHWETVSGESQELPITIENEGFYVDDTPAKGGLFNPGIKLGFDSKGFPVIGYHKYDADGNNQLYAARYDYDAGTWFRKQLTDWNYRWQFEGRGSINCELDIFVPKVIGDGKMAFPYRHVKEGEGEIVFDENTFEVYGKRGHKPLYPEKFDVVTSPDSDMRAHVILCGDYLLRWETLPANRDVKPQGELPQPSALVLYKWR